MKVKCRGSQGSWEATAVYPDRSQEVLACGHAHWVKGGPGGLYYSDPWTPELMRTNRFAKHVELLRSKNRVIITSDEINEAGGRGAGYFKRTGYQGIFTIDGLIVDDAGMRFRLIARIADIG
jgi:hypothetical protein